MNLIIVAAILGLGGEPDSRPVVQNAVYQTVAFVNKLSTQEKDGKRKLPQKKNDERAELAKALAELTAELDRARAAIAELKAKAAAEREKAGNRELMNKLEVANRLSTLGQPN